MSPFNGHPEGFSAATLELLDQGLHRMWLEAQPELAAKKKAMEHVRLASAFDSQTIDRDKRD